MERLCRSHHHHTWSMLAKAILFRFAIIESTRTQCWSRKGFDAIICAVPQRCEKNVIAAKIAQNTGRWNVMTAGMIVRSQRLTLRDWMAERFVVPSQYDNTCAGGVLSTERESVLLCLRARYTDWCGVVKRRCSLWSWFCWLPLVFFHFFFVLFCWTGESCKSNWLWRILWVEMNLRFDWKVLDLWFCGELVFLSNLKSFAQFLSQIFVFLLRF